MILITSSDISDAAWLTLLRTSDALARAAFPNERQYETPPDESVLDVDTSGTIIVSRSHAVRPHAEGENE